jgi:hypothetical protein
MSPLKVAAIDTVVFLGLASLVLLFAGVPESQAAMFTLIAGIASLAVIIAWRGYTHFQSLAAGTDRWYKPIIEGFAVGFLPPFAMFVLPAINTAFAAGNVYDSAASWGVVEWGNYLLFALGTSSLGGFAGAVVASVLSVLNRLLLRAAA